MSNTAATAQSGGIQWPDNTLGYVAIIAAIVTGVLHLLAVTRAIQFSQTLAILFALNGLGFLGGIGVYLTRYWRRSLFLVAAAYSVVTILALFAFQGWSIEAFYMGGSLNPIAVISKVAEAVLAIAALALYGQSPG
jgi:small basic protein